MEEEEDVRITTRLDQPRRLRLTVRPIGGTPPVVLAPVHPDDTVGQTKARVRLALPHLPERQQRFIPVGGGRHLGPDQDHLTLAQCGIVPAAAAAAASSSGSRDQSGSVDSTTTTTTTDTEEEWEDLEVRLLAMALHACVWEQAMTTPAKLAAGSIAARRVKADVARRLNGGGERWFEIGPDPTKAQGDLPSVFQVTLLGFEGTPYEGGKFVVDVEVPASYPFDPPRLRMRTPIYHPTVKANGTIAVLSLTPPPPPPPEETAEATAAESGAGEGWKAEVEQPRQYWAPQRSFLDVVELVHRQLRLARPWSPLFGVVCGYQPEEWSGRALLERRRRLAGQRRTDPPRSGLDGVALFRSLGVLRRAGPPAEPLPPAGMTEEEAEQVRRRLVEAKARALTRFHATDGRYVWHERDHIWLPPALRRDVVVLLLLVRRQPEGLRLPEELVRLIVQELARLHHEASTCGGQQPPRGSK